MTAALALATTLSGCGGGGGSAVGASTGGSVLPPGATFSKIARVTFTTAKQSVQAATGTTSTTGVPDGQISQPNQVRNLKLQVLDVVNGETSLIKEVTREVPPFQGEIVVPDIPPGNHLLSFSATDSEGRLIFGAEQTAQFSAGASTFVDFIATPIEVLNSETFRGGRIQAERFAFVLAASQSPYTINQATFVEEGGRLIIEPGVRINFVATGELIVRGGRLTAVGTADQPIVMIRGNSTLTAGNRLSFFNTKPDPIRSRISFAAISEASTGILLIGSDVSVTNNDLRSVSVGIFTTASSETGSVVKSTGKVTANTIRATSAGIFVRGSNTQVTSNVIEGSSVGIFMEDASSLVENNQISNNRASGIRMDRCTSTVLNNNKITQTSGVMNVGINVMASNALLSQNHIRATSSAVQVQQGQTVPSSGIRTGISILKSVSGSANTDRLVLDHNTIEGAVGAAIAIIAADPVIRFNTLVGSAGLTAGVQDRAVTIDCVTQDCPGLGLATTKILPKQPLLIGNNIVNFTKEAVAGDPLFTLIFQNQSVAGGGVLGSSLPGGGNYVAGNNSVTAPESTVSGTVDQVFDTTTSQIKSVDAILSTTSSAVIGAGAPNTSVPPVSAAGTATGGGNLN